MKDGGVFLGPALVFLVFLPALWLLSRYCLRWHSKRMQALMDHRIAERERAFVELHDALLQDVQGLTLSLQAIADQMPPNEPARLRLEHALDRADELLARGRKRVRGAGHARDGPD
ncbi:MAG: two-component system sensor protein [Phenylobacterium sp.]|jgi:signal transduction histidine kinase|uniref:histidine kinase n=1 Tax=Phenylobacterium sp. TaxID=1871053 RepID=UPI00260693C4|nr:histidine kinase [Phenylobacterium sp.]MDB5427602.1 two-component system sensor protein [Phenylobacterium sp.]MDB5436105.1 two-component system sensor protein [Phenylobacterium sp.]MDB5464837.1 two-component system sensor protein [Phenylobacterium sp.]MDB5498893.1 two-component system sensor protein [Phenylobacterium sp.]